MPTAASTRPGVELPPPHPAADVWPMLPADELAALGADIEANGLIHPLVDWVDVDGVRWLLDGCNRGAACALVGMAPTWTTYEGDDPVAYVLGSNSQRRHMSKGQRAMAGVVTACTVENKQSSTQEELAAFIGIARLLVAYASTVLDYAPDQVRPVILGTVSLSDAYKDAQARKAATEQAVKTLAALDADAPDLADLREERMTLAEAYGAARERERVRTDERRDATALLNRILDPTAPVNATDDFVETWANHLGDVDRDLDPSDRQRRRRSHPDSPRS